MPLIRWLSRMIAALGSRLSGRRDSTAFRPRLHRLKVVPCAMCAALLLSLISGNAIGQAQTVSGTIVAAGFGYQIGETSTIAVKVYDAVSGTVLSDESFELNVKEDRPSPSTPLQARIFAGGVGPGATDLSNFVLRVYDAKTGAFQWEGQLNLTPQEEAGSGHLVSTLVQRRATVTRIHAVEKAAKRPLFLLRALDSLTGGLVWEDEFSTDGRKLGRFERVADRGIGSEGDVASASHTFDFRIRMFDADGRTLLWEDQFAQQTAQEDSSETFDERAQLLQAWPRPFEPHDEPEAI